MDTDMKRKATEARAAMGLTASEAVRLLFHRIAVDQAFPLELKVPNAATRAAMAEIDEMVWRDSRVRTTCLRILKKPPTGKRAEPLRWVDYSSMPHSVLNGGITRSRAHGRARSPRAAGTPEVAVNGHDQPVARRPLTREMRRTPDQPAEILADPTIP